MTDERSSDMAREDEVPPGTPHSGEDVCPECRGTGEVDGDPCPGCDGTGRVVEAIGGG
jgi:DnaJ-class molecular chaperone